ncbi:hypothetical protein [Microbacterium sp. GXF6406]
MSDFTLPLAAFEAALIEAGVAMQAPSAADVRRDPCDPHARSIRHELEQWLDWGGPAPAEDGSYTPVFGSFQKLTPEQSRFLKDGFDSYYHDESGSPTPWCPVFLQSAPRGSLIPLATDGERTVLLQLSSGSIAVQGRWDHDRFRVLAPSMAELLTGWTDLVTNDMTYNSGTRTWIPRRTDSNWNEGRLRIGGFV